MHCDLTYHVRYQFNIPTLTYRQLPFRCLSSLLSPRGRHVQTRSNHFGSFENTVQTCICMYVRMYACMQWYVRILYTRMFMYMCVCMYACENVRYQTRATRYHCKRQCNSPNFVQLRNELVAGRRPSLPSREQILEDIVESLILALTRNHNAD